jgi:hypothetical protein
LLRQRNLQSDCRWTAVVVSLVVGVFWLKFSLAFEDVFGFRFTFGITATLAIVMLSIAPFWLTDATRSELKCTNNRIDAS